MDSKPTQKILIAIPAHNEASSLLGVISGIREATQHLDAVSLVVFNDASTDTTEILLREHNIPSVTINQRFGLGYVFARITRHALEYGFDILLTIDGDRQFDPRGIEHVLRPILEGAADMTTGSRFMKDSTTRNISTLKRLGNQLGAWYISSILKKRYYDVTCGFRAYSRDALLRLHTFSDFTYTQEVLLNLGFKKLIIKEVPIHTEYFKERKSKMTGKIFRYIYKSIKIILKSMLIYSPMKLFSKLAAVSFGLGLSGGIFVFFWDMAHGTVTPFKWLAVTTLVLGSLAVFLYCVGILLQITSRLQLTLEENLYYQKRTRYNTHD